MPRETRGAACHLLEAYGLRLVLDLGGGSLRSLARLGEPVAALNAVGITHRHQDHLADLLPLLFALRYVPELARSSPLDVFGYPGLPEDLAGLAAIYGPWVLEPGFELRVRALPPGETLELAAGGGRARVAAHAVRHSPEAVGFRIRLWREAGGAGAGVEGRGATAVEPGGGGEAGGGDEGGSRVVSYSGDTGPTPELVELARGADLFVCECAFPDDREVPGHMTPSALLEVCRAARPRRVVATHFYPVWDERGVERLWSEAVADREAAALVTPAHDGLVIELTG